MTNLIRKGLRGLIRTTSVSDNPPSGQRALIPKTDGWYDRDSTGTEVKLGSGGGSSTVPTQPGDPGTGDGTLWWDTDDNSGYLNLTDLNDVTVTSPATGDVIRWSGTEFVNAALAQSDVSGLVAALAAKLDKTGGVVGPLSLNDALLTVGSTGTNGFAKAISVIRDGAEVGVVDNNASGLRVQAKSGTLQLRGTGNNGMSIDSAGVVTFADRATGLANATGVTDALPKGQADGLYAATSHTHTKSNITDFAHTHSVTDLTATGTKDGTKFLRDDNTWAVPAGGGGSDPLLLATEYSSTTPTAPTTGITIFARNRARRIPAFIGPSGQDSQLQPALFSNRISQYKAQNGVVALQGDGLPAPSIVGTSSAVTLAATNFYTSMTRTRVSGAAAAGSAASIRTPNAQWHMSSTANKGGFFWVARLGLGTSATAPRAFFGFANITTAFPAASDITTNANYFGFGADAGDANFSFTSNDASGAGVKTSLGANFPCQLSAAGVYFYEFRLFAPSGGGATVYWSAQRLNDGAFASGGPVTTDLPPVDTLLASHLMLSSGTTSTAVSLDVQSLYIETDN